MKNIFNSIKKKIYFFLVRVFYKFGHRYNPRFNTVFNNIHSENCTFFDLQNLPKFDNSKFTKNHLISVLDRKDKYLNINKNIFECWIKNDFYSYSDNLDNFYTHKKKILKSFLNKPNRNYKEKIYLLPYYHNQAGHFMAEVFGCMLFFLELFKKRGLNEKILIICPSKKWEDFFKKFYNKNVIFFNDNFFLKKNTFFERSQILPKFHPYQNYIISKNILSQKIENVNFKNKKVFLTSERVERISNIEEVIIYLKKKKFIIVNPKKVSVLNLFKILYSAKIVVSEHASISHNIHIARNKPYFLLLPKAFKTINKKWYRITSIFNNFNSALYKPIYCENSDEKKYVIPLQEQIKVDLKKLSFL